MRQIGTTGKSLAWRKIVPRAMFSCPGRGAALGGKLCDDDSIRPKTSAWARNLRATDVVVPHVERGRPATKKSYLNLYLVQTAYFQHALLPFLIPHRILPDAW